MTTQVAGSLPAITFCMACVLALFASVGPDPRSEGCRLRTLVGVARGASVADSAAN